MCGADLCCAGSETREPAAKLNATGRSRWRGARTLAVVPKPAEFYTPHHSPALVLNLCKILLDRTLSTNFHEPQVSHD